MEVATMCDREELILDYVYDELSRGERADLEAHLAGCAACRTELEALRATRGYLAQWTPPLPDLGFRVIRGGGAPAPALPRRTPLAPAFAYAAAAVIVLAVGAAIANLDVRYTAEGMTVRTGWGARAGAPSLDAREAAAAPAATSAAAPAAPAAATADVTLLEQRLRDIEAALAARPAAGVQLAAGPRMSDAEILRRVRDMVSDAEARQETAVAERLLAVVRDFDRQRRADIALIQQGLGQYQGLTNAEIAQNRDMLNQLVRAASTRQEK